MVYIYGSGKCGNDLLSKLNKDNQLDMVKGMIDKNPNATNQFDKPLFTIGEIVEKVLNGEEVTIIVALLSEWERVRVIGDLNKNGIENIYLMEKDFDILDIHCFTNDGELGPLLYKWNSRKPSLYYVQVDVTKYCNLKCNGCSVFSNLVEKFEPTNIEHMKESLEYLKNTFSRIDNFVLFGGEPLTNPMLDKYIYMVREAFPYTKLIICTNGILIPKIEEHIWNAIIKNSVWIKISIYPELLSQVRNNIDILSKKGVPYMFHEYRNKFLTVFDKTASADPELAHNKYCYYSSCVYMKDGYLYPCSTIIDAYEHKDILGWENLNVDDLDDCRVKIDEDMKGWETLFKLYNTVPGCKVCALERKEIKWKRGEKMKREDWISD